MPELAEVEFFRKQWNPGIGHKVLKVQTHPNARVYRDSPASEVRKAIAGKEFVSSMAHGKKLCFRFGGDGWLGLHMGMTGKLQTAAQEMVPDRHDHLVIFMKDVALVFSDYRMFGKVQAHSGTNAPEWWSGLPPQVQEEAFTATRFRHILERHSRKPMKALLLEQNCFPGIGNWMADEILWRARIHPEQTAMGISSYKRRQLFHSLKEVVSDAFEVIGTSWGDPPDNWLFNHRWSKGGTCPKSGKPLDRITVGGRTTCYSPAIQKLNA